MSSREESREGGEEGKGGWWERLTEEAAREVVAFSEEAALRHLAVSAHAVRQPVPDDVAVRLTRPLPRRVHHRRVGRVQEQLQASWGSGD